MTSVKQKLAAINQKKTEVAAGARKLQGAINTQKNANRSAVAAIHSGARKVATKIREQEKVNAAAVVAIDAGTRKVGEGIQAMGRAVDAGAKKVQAATRAQAAENGAYIKDFYFGEGK